MIGGARRDDLRVGAVLLAAPRSMADAIGRAFRQACWSNHSKPSRSWH
jgi:hypothetical protein